MGNWKRAIAIDFDGTLCENEYPDIGEPNWNVIYQAIQEAWCWFDSLDLPGR